MGYQMTKIMTFQPRMAVLAVAVLSVLTACGEGSDPITGENSVISTTSIPVIGPDGTNVTAVNQQNFPLAGALPLASETPEVGAAVPENSNSGNSNTGAVLASEEAVEAPEAAAVPTGNPAAQSDFFVASNALANVDTEGQVLLSMINAITTIVVSEYQSVMPTNQTFSDDTLQISRRIGEKISCDQGQVDSSFDMNGTDIVDGSVVFSDCGSNGYVLNGDVALASVSITSSDSVLVGLRSVSVAFNDSATFFDGVLNVVFTGDSFRVTSDLIESNTNGSLDRFTSVDLSGVNTSGVARTLSGTTTFTDTVTGDIIDYTFTDVSVTDGENVPTSGSTSLEHADGSSIDFDFETGDLTTFTYTVTQTDASSVTVLEQWSNVGFRVPQL